MTGRQPERVGRGGGLELIRPSAADETERLARALIAASPGLTAAAKQIEQDHLTRHLAAGQAGQRTLDAYNSLLGPLRALGRNGAFGDAWDGDTLPIPTSVVLAYLRARAGEITHVTAEHIVKAVLWVHRNGRWPDQDQADTLDTDGWENPAGHPAIKAHLAGRADGENRPDRTQCLALTILSCQVGQRCRADTRSGDRCGRSTITPDGLCCVHRRTAEPVHPAEIAVELRRCQNFTIRGESLCDKHHAGHERCRADLAGFDSGDGRARCPFPAAPPVLCADHQHHPAKGSPTLDRRCRATDIDEPCPNPTVATHLCRMHQAAEPVHPESQVGVLADEPVILPGPTKKALAIRLPDLEAGCAYDPEPERLAQLAAVRDTLPHRVEMWHMADLGPDDITFTDTDTGGTVTVQFQVPTRPSGGMPRQIPALEDGAWLEARYVTDGATIDEIAAEVGCSIRPVGKALARHGISPRPGRRRKFPALEDGAWLEARYVTDRATTSEIAAEVGCSQAAVGKALARHGIPTRRRGQRRSQFPALEDGAWLEARYVAAATTIAEIAAEVGCSQAAVRTALARHGIPTRPAQRPNPYPALEDGAWLEARYVTDGATIAEIAAEVGCSIRPVGKALARHGISPRPGRRRKFPALEDGAWLEARYVVAATTIAEIAAEVGCSQAAVRTALDRHGIPTRTPGPVRQFPALEDGAWLEARYVTAAATIDEIAAEVGCSHTTVGKALARHGIEAPFRTVVLEASGGADCPVAAIRAVLANPHHPDPNRPFTHPYQAAASLPGPYSAWVEARDSSILPVGFWLGRRGGELGQTQLAQLSVREIDGQRRVMFTVNPKHSKTGDSRELVLPPCTCAAEIITREPMSLTPEMQALIADQGDDPDGCRLERLVPKIARRPALCVVCSLARWLAMRWQQPGPTVRCPDGGCGDAAGDWIAGFLRSLPERDRLHRIWPPLKGTSKQAREETWQNPDPFRSLDADDISNIVRRRLERAELDPSSSHGLKRGAVTGMTEAGMDLAEISEITGNTNLAVLAGYIADDVAERRRIEAGQRSLGVLWLPDDQDAFTVGGDTAAA